MADGVTLWLTVSAVVVVVVAVYEVCSRDEVEQPTSATTPARAKQGKIRFTPRFVAESLDLSSRSSIHRAEHGFDRREFDVRVHPCAPFGFAVGQLDLDVGDGARLRAFAQGVLAEIDDFKRRRAVLMQG